VAFELKAAELVNSKKISAHDLERLRPRVSDTNSLYLKIWGYVANEKLDMNNICILAELYDVENVYELVDSLNTIRRKVYAT
jgi:hypothetical protein